MRSILRVKTFKRSNCITTHYFARASTTVWENSSYFWRHPSFLSRRVSVIIVYVYLSPSSGCGIRSVTDIHIEMAVLLAAHTVINALLVFPQSFAGSALPLRFLFDCNLYPARLGSLWVWCDAFNIRRRRRRRRRRRFYDRPFFTL